MRCDQHRQPDILGSLCVNTSYQIYIGSARPLDDELNATPYVTRWWGLTSGSLVRWYVEGDTEYGAIRYYFSNPSTFGIELVNLKGMIRDEKANAALTLEQLLDEDKADELKHRVWIAISLIHRTREDSSRALAGSRSNQPLLLLPFMDK